MSAYGFIYLTTNIKNGKMYIGQARYRANLSKKYLGSGKEIRQAIEKHGRSSFTREILFEAFSKEDLDWAECHFIAEADAVKSRQYYNISPGGRASLGFTGKQHTITRNDNLSKKMLTDNPPPIAKCVTIDNVIYNSISQASCATGFSRQKILRFIKSGIHPADQRHGLLGKKRNIVQNKRNTWVLMGLDGHTQIVTGLSSWCKANNVSYAIRDHQGTFYKGWKLTRISN